MKMFSVTSVVCSRGGTFDAELAFTVEYYGSVVDGKRKTTQKLIEAGFSTREAAKTRAEAEKNHVEALMESPVLDYLKKYQDAQA